MRLLLLLLLSCLVVPGPGLAQSIGSASGILDSREGQSPTAGRVEIEITQAVAFPGDYQDYDFVLLSAGVSVDQLEQAISPRALLMARAGLQGADYVTGSVKTDGARAFASFSRNAVYGGSLGSGLLHGARIEQGRLRGRLQTADSATDAVLEARLDAPIITRASGSPLPVDGGAPWRDFVLLRDALRAGEEAPIRALLGATILHQLPRDQPFETILPQLVKNFPMDARFVSGALTPVDARLVLLDDSGSKPVRCVVVLLPEGNQWRVHGLSFRHGDMPVDRPPPSNAFTDAPTEGS